MALPAPAAQPRALFGGHLCTAAVGIACYHAFGDAAWVYALAQGLALGVMLVTRTVHPPAGTNPILMIYVHAGWSALFLPVLVGITALAICAAFWSRLFPGMVHYPVNWSEGSPPHPLWGGWTETSIQPADEKPATGPRRHHLT